MEKQFSLFEAAVVMDQCNRACVCVCVSSCKSPATLPTDPAHTDVTPHIYTHTHTQLSGFIQKVNLSPSYSVQNCDTLYCYVLFNITVERKDNVSLCVCVCVCLFLLLLHFCGHF